jgi:hypothetical protein
MDSKTFCKTSNKKELKVSWHILAEVLLFRADK